METKLIYSMPSRPRFAIAKSAQRNKSSPTASTIHPRQLSIIRATVSPDSNSGGSTDSKGKESNEVTSSLMTERQASPGTLRIRYRAPSRSQAKKEKEKLQQGLQKTPTPPKKWEDMTLSEKALELYVGEKGLLFWLNKLAYASIFAVIAAESCQHIHYGAREELKTKFEAFPRMSEEYVLNRSNLHRSKREQQEHRSKREQQSKRAAGAEE